MIKYYFTLYMSYLKSAIDSSFQYRANLYITTITSIIQDGSSLFFLSIIFSNIRKFEGWSFLEMTLIWALTLISRNLYIGFLNVPDRLANYIMTGKMDRIMIRPSGMMFQIACESGINISAIIRSIVGIVTIAIIFPMLRLQWWGPLYIILIIITGSLLIYGLNTIIGCLTFIFIRAQSLLTMVVWIYQFGQYPANIFAFPISFIFTWILPFAMMGFYPAAFLLRGDKYFIYGLIAPLMGILFFMLAIFIWNKSIKLYQSSGS